MKMPLFFVIYTAYFSQIFKLLTIFRPHLTSNSRIIEGAYYDNHFRQQVTTLSFYDVYPLFGHKRHKKILPLPGRIEKLLRYNYCVTITCA